MSCSYYYLMHLDGPHVRHLGKYNTEEQAEHYAELYKVPKGQRRIRFAPTRALAQRSLGLDP